MKSAYYAPPEGECPTALDELWNKPINMASMLRKTVFPTCSSERTGPFAFRDFPDEIVAYCLSALLIQSLEFIAGCCVVDASWMNEAKCGLLRSASGRSH